MNRISRKSPPQREAHWHTVRMMIGTVVFVGLFCGVTFVMLTVGSR